MTRFVVGAICSLFLCVQGTTVGAGGFSSSRLLVFPSSVVSQDSTLIIDTFESITAWESRPSDGVSVRLSQESGVRGRALRVDFDFHGGGGYAVIRREVDLTLPPNYEFRWLDHQTLSPDASASLNSRLLRGASARIDQRNS